MTKHPLAACGLVDERSANADEGALTGAVRPEQREEIALRNVQVDALQGLYTVTVLLDEVANFERLHERRKIARARPTGCVRAALARTASAGQRAKPR